VNQFSPNASGLSRRAFLASAGAVGVSSMLANASASAGENTQIALPFDGGEREIVTDFPQKGPMILQRTRPPLLETPFKVFDRGVFTPNDRFYVRWHLPNIPTSIDPTAFRLQVHGQVRQPLSLSLQELVREFPAFEIAAVNQCSGNSRGLFAPRVTGAQWGNGAMGNALWRGVRLKDVLDRTNVGPGARWVRFRGLDSGVLPATPRFMKSLEIDHARDGEVMLAYQMNGGTLPLLNGFPIRLVVPGWYATYWVKMLTEIEVLDHPDENFWTKKAYLIPDTPGANIAPDQKDVSMIPINRMVPRSFFISPTAGSTVTRAQALVVRGIAFGGDSGVAKVQVSVDGGRSWRDARLGPDQGKYGFREWQLPVHFTVAGPQTLMVRAVNTAGLEQPDRPNWNPSGFMRNVVESLTLQVA
jgi:DMSO/TMAO reductase YedYZ molybdopterin-dependent catalytic subunit